MSTIIFYILSCYGATLILVYGKIFEKIRPKYHFFHCSMCIGFWVGLFFAFFGMNITNLFQAFMWACLASGTSYILCTLFDDNGLKIERN